MSLILHIGVLPFRVFVRVIVYYLQIHRYIDTHTYTHMHVHIHLHINDLLILVSVLVLYLCCFQKNLSQEAMLLNIHTRRQLSCLNTSESSDFSLVFIPPSCETRIRMSSWSKKIESTCVC